MTSSINKDNSFDCTEKSEETIRKEKRQDNLSTRNKTEHQGKQNKHVEGKEEHRESRKCTVSSKGDCHQVDKSLKKQKLRKEKLKTLEKKMQLTEKIRNELNETMPASTETQKSENKVEDKKSKSKRRSRRVQNSDQNVKFAEILRKRLEEELTKLKHNGTHENKEKHAVVINGGVVVDKKEDMKHNYGDSVSGNKKGTNINDKEPEEKVNEVKTSCKSEQDHINKHKTSKKDAEKRMRKSNNKTHVKDGIKNESKTENRSKNIPQNISEECLDEDVYKQFRKSDHIQSNRYFIIKYDSDHDEEKQRSQKRNSYNPFQNNVDVMENGIFRRGNFKKMRQSAQRKKYLYRAVSEVSILSSSIEVVEEEPTNLYSSYQNILFHTHTKGELYWRLERKYQRCDIPVRDVKSPKIKKNKSNINDNKTHKRHINEENIGKETNKIVNISSTETNKNRKTKRMLKPKCNTWTIEAPHGNAETRTTGGVEYREKVLRTESRPISRCLFSEDDDKQVVLRMVQEEIQKQYQRIKEVRIQNDLKQKERQRERNESVERSAIKMKKESEGPFYKSSKDCSTYKDEKGEKLINKQNDGLQTLKVNNATKDRIINKTLNKITHGKSEVSTDDSNEKNEDLLTPNAKEFEDGSENPVEKEDISQSFVDIHDIGVNVPPPHHSQRKCRYLRVPSKKDRNKPVRVGGGWSDVNDYYERHVPVKRREYKRTMSSNNKGRSFLSFQSHYKCPPKRKHHQTVKTSVNKNVTWD